MFSDPPGTDWPWVPPSLPWGLNSIWTKHLNTQLQTVKMSKICKTQHPHLQYAFVTRQSNIQPTSYLLPPLYMVASCNIVHFFNIQAPKILIHTQSYSSLVMHRPTAKEHEDCPACQALYFLNTGSSKKMDGI